MSVAVLHPGLLQNILDNPEDEAVWLVCADWLEEQGDLDRANFLRCTATTRRIGPPRKLLPAHSREHLGGGHFRISVHDNDKPEVGERIDVEVFGRFRDVPHSVHGLLVARVEERIEENGEFEGYWWVYAVTDERSVRRGKTLCNRCHRLSKRLLKKHMDDWAMIAVSNIQLPLG